MTQHAWKVVAAQAGQRLDQCVLGELQFRYSRAQIQRWLVDGFVRLNGSVVPAHRRVKARDAITVDLAAAQASRPVRTLAPEPIPLTIVYEDAELLVVDKPAGLVTHPAPGHWSGTLVHAVLWHLQQQRSFSESRQALGVQRSAKSVKRQNRQANGLAALDVVTPNALAPNAERLTLDASLRPGIVHRLDKDTSGLLVIAKTDRAHLALAKQLKARTMRRTYLACVEGRLELDAGTVNAPIGRHLTDRKRMSVRHLGGRAAVTHYRVLRRVPACAASRDAAGRPSSAVGPYTVVECRLDTGRTHQVRVHMAHLGHPILGDATYGKTTRGQFPRHFLHAVQLALRHPVTGALLTLCAEVPAIMQPFIGDVTT